MVIPLNKVTAFTVKNGLANKSVGSWPHDPLAKDWTVHISETGKPTRVYGTTVTTPEIDFASPAIAPLIKPKTNYTLTVIANPVDATAYSSSVPAEQACWFTKNGEATLGVRSSWIKLVWAKITGFMVGMIIIGIVAGGLGYLIKKYKTNHGQQGGTVQTITTTAVTNAAIVTNSALTLPPAPPSCGPTGGNQEATGSSKSIEEALKKLNSRFDNVEAWVAEVNAMRGGHAGTNSNLSIRLPRNFVTDNNGPVIIVEKDAHVTGPLIGTATPAQVAPAAEAKKCDGGPRAEIPGAWPAEARPNKTVRVGTDLLPGKSYEFTLGVGDCLQIFTSDKCQIRRYDLVGNIDNIRFREGDNRGSSTDGSYRPANSDSWQNRFWQTGCCPVSFKIEVIPFR